MLVFCAYFWPQEWMMKNLVIKGCLAACLLLATTPFASANLVVNGGFETGDFSGWTTMSAASGSFYSVGSSGQHSGAHAADFGAFGADLDAISQTFATTPGTIYNLTFWLQENSTTPFSSEFRVTFGGVTELDLMDSSGFPYTEFNYSLLATGSSLTLEFAGRNARALYILDDVDVEAGAAGVPDSGSTLAIAVTAFVGLFFFRLTVGRRRAAQI